MATAFHRSVRFNLSDESGRVQVNVIDTDSDKVIREIPPKETLNVAKRIKDFLGLILDEKR
jgi:flagellar protein FlaG